MGRATHYRSRYAFDLSPRQREVLERIARGCTNAEIAGELGISLDGVKWHVREVLGKLGVDSREEAAGLWRASRRPGARLRRLVPAIVTGLSWRALAAGGVAVVAVAGALAGYAAFRDGPSPAPAAAATSTQSPPRTVAESATPGPPVANCDPAQLALKPAASSNGEPAVAISVLFQNTGDACEASGTLSLSIVAAGGGLVPGIVGNSMQFAVDFEVQAASNAGAGSSGAGIAEWSNWCGAGVGAEVQMMFEPGSLSTTVPIGGLPSCTDRGSPSVLRQPIGTGPPPGQGAFVLKHRLSSPATVVPSVSPTPVPAGEPLPYCDSSRLKLATTAAGKATDVDVAGFDGDCRIDWPSASFRLVSLVGTLLPVDGNGAPVAMSGTSKGPPLGVEMQWSNWCGTHTDVVLELDTGGARIDTYVAPPPCDDEDQPSAVRYTPLPAGFVSPSPAAVTLLPRCDPDQLTPGLSNMEAAKDVTVRVQVSNDGPACSFSGDVMVTVKDAGVAIQAPGNPGVVRITAEFPAGGGAPVAFGVWPDVCLNGESMSLTAQLAGANGATPGTTAALPAACAAVGVPSSVRLSPANAYASAGVAVCDPSQLDLTSAAQGVAQQEFITMAIDAAQPCWLSGTLRSTVATPGGGSVSGNPADLQVRALLLPGANAIGAAYWSNWCGSKAAGAVTVTLVNTDLASTAKGPPPACDSPVGQSRLRLAPWDG